jgi:uncharacterized protein (DUF433 family)
MAVQVAAPQVNDTATEHPHIVLIQKMDRQQAVIRGTRMPVWVIAGFYKAGDTMDDILMSYPHLSPASVYDAISYYHDHQTEIEAEIAAQRIENVLKQTGGVIDERGFIHFPDLRKTK